MTRIRAHTTLAQPPQSGRVGTAPALNPPRWSGRKTAVAAALAVSVGAGGAVAATAVAPRENPSAQHGPGGFGAAGMGGPPGQGAGLPGGSVVPGR